MRFMGSERGEMGRVHPHPSGEVRSNPALAALSASKIFTANATTVLPLT